MRWDATRLPLPDASADHILCNPPFGKQLSDPAAIGPLYRRMLPEFNRVLKPGGRAVLLVSDLPARDPGFPYRSVFFVVEPSRMRAEYYGRTERMYRRAAWRFWDPIPPPPPPP